MRHEHRHRAPIWLLVLVLLSACGPLGATPTPIPGPPLTGRLFVHVWSSSAMPEGIYLIAPGQTPKIVASDLVDNSWHLSLANGIALLFRKDERGITRTDLQTGVEERVLPEPVECMSVSPDGLKISYTAGPPDAFTLSVLDLQQHTVEELALAPWAEYQTGRYHGALDCGSWLGFNRVLFRRFAGMMPAVIDIIGRGEVASNVTSLSPSDGQGPIRDSPLQWHINAVPPDGKLVVFDRGCGPPCTQQASLEAAPLNGCDALCFYPTDTFDLTEHGRVLCAATIWDCGAVGFAPTSGAFVVEDLQGTPASGQVYTLTFYDPATLTAQQSKTIPPAWHQSWVWAGADTVIAFTSTSKEQLAAINLGDLDTGGQTVVWEMGKGTFASSLGWLP